METIEKIRQEIEDYSATLTCIDADIAELKMSIQHCEEQKVKVQDIILGLKQELCRDEKCCEQCPNLGICATDACPTDISVSIHSI